MDRETEYIMDNLKWGIFKYTCTCGTFYIYQFLKVSAWDITILHSSN